MRLSIVLPALDEEANIATSVRRALDALARLGLAGEVVVVDDGSGDGTAARVEALAAGDPRVRLVRHARNRGYGAALRSGFAAARGELIFFTDADLQFDLAELDGLLARLPGHDLVVGYRRLRRDPLHRALNAWAWGRLVEGLLGVGVRDVNCAFKLLRREVLAGCELRSTGAFVNTELLVRARAAGFSLAEIPVSHYPRPAGAATGARLAVIGRSLAEMGQLYGSLARR